MSENVQKQVVWFLKNKNLIKFTDSEVTYKLSEPLLKSENSILKGDKVEVGIKDGVVVYISKVTNDVKKVEEEKPKAPAPAPKVVEPEVKKEEPTPKVDGETSTVLTVFAVAANKKVVKFLEVKDAGWFQIDTAIQAQDYAVIGLQAKNKVKVTFNDKTVISVAKVASEPAETPKTPTSSPANAKVEPTAAPAVQAPVQAPKKEWKPASSYDTADRQKSIEAQAAVNSANEVAGQVAAAIARESKKVNEDGSVITNAPTANTINNMIRAIAENNFALIQELKNK